MPPEAVYRTQLDRLLSLGGREDQTCHQYLWSRPRARGSSPRPGIAVLDNRNLGTCVRTRGESRRRVKVREARHVYPANIPQNHENRSWRVRGGAGGFARGARGDESAKSRGGTRRPRREVRTHLFSRPTPSQTATLERGGGDPRARSRDAFPGPRGRRSSPDESVDPSLRPLATATASSSSSGRSLGERSSSGSPRESRAFTSSWLPSPR